MRRFRGWGTHLLTRRHLATPAPSDVVPLTHDALTQRVQTRLITASDRQLRASRTEIMRHLFTGPDLHLLASAPTQPSSTDLALGHGRPLEPAHTYDLFVFTGPDLSAAVLLGTRSRNGYAPVTSRDAWVGWADLDPDRRTMILTSAYRNTVTAPTLLDLLHATAAIAHDDNRPGFVWWHDHLDELVALVRAHVPHQDRAAIDLLSGLGGFRA